MPKKKSDVDLLASAEQAVAKLEDQMARGALATKKAREAQSARVQASGVMVAEAKHYLAHARQLMRQIANIKALPVPVQKAHRLSRTSTLLILTAQCVDAIKRATECLKGA